MKQITNIPHGFWRDRGQKGWFFLQNEWQRLRRSRRRQAATAFLAIFGIWFVFFALPRPLFDAPLSVVLEDRDGYLLGAKIAADGQWRFPPSDSVPTKFAQAIVAFEDRRFYYHLGIDPIGLGRALWQNVRRGKVVSGGSTLTMQVIRLARRGKRRTIWEKGIEFLLATRLELGSSKRQILNHYAQHAPFGGNVVGLEAAAWRYFGKKPSLLSWGEAAALAVLPNAPALIHPGRNRQALLSKRNRLLERMLAAGVFDKATCELAKDEPLPDAPLPLPQIAPHLLDAFAKGRFGRKKDQSRYASTLSAPLQQHVNDVLLKHYTHLSLNGVYNLAAVVADTETGDVVAYVGNIYGGFNAEHGHAVDVVQSPRSTGSILKPFLYALSLQDGLLLPTAVLPDVPTQINNYRPLNFNQRFDGVVPADRALARSLNVPAVRMLQQYGIEKFHHRLQKLGITTLRFSPKHYGLPLILGGAEATLWDITGVYATMGRTLHHYYQQQGKYDPSDIRPLNVAAAETAQPLPPQKWVAHPPLLSASAIWNTFEALLEVERPREDGAWAVYQSNRKIAWKTGTSYGFRDAWAVGVNPRYTIGIWVGNADGEGRPGVIGSQAAAPILFDLFNRLTDAVAWFDAPHDELERVEVCALSGYRAKRLCAKRDTVLAPPNASLSPLCPYHQTVHLDPSRQWRVHSDCLSPSEMVHESWYVLPPVEEYYYKSKDPNYKVLPPFRQGCAASLAAKDQPMQMIYPRKVTQIFVPTNLDGTQSKTVFKVAHRKPTTTIYWHLDEVYLGSTQTFHEMELAPPAGEHEVVLVDEDGNRLSQRFVVLSDAE